MQASKKFSIIIEDEQSESNPVTHMSPGWHTPPDTLYLNLRHQGDKAALCSCKQIYAFSWTDFDPSGTDATPNWSKHLVCHLTAHTLTSARGSKTRSAPNPLISEMWMKTKWGIKQRASGSWHKLFTMWEQVRVVSCSAGEDNPTVKKKKP